MDILGHFADVFYAPYPQETPRITCVTSIRGESPDDVIAPIQPRLARSLTVGRAYANTSNTLDIFFTINELFDRDTHCGKSIRAPNSHS